MSPSGSERGELGGVVPPAYCGRGSTYHRRAGVDSRYISDEFSGKKKILAELLQAYPGEHKCSTHTDIIGYSDMLATAVSL